ncbi:MAG: hypothetical protein ACPGVB_15380 [Chitinophagales bacterium]
MSQLTMYQIFGLRKVMKMESLTQWLNNLPELNHVEKIIATHYQGRLLENIDAWNEQELSLNFIGPIFASIDFTVLNQINWFAQRPISSNIGDYLLMGKPDGIIASGYLAPEKPYFAFQEFKRELDSSGDPIGQNLAAMLIGQEVNDNDQPIYGCYVVGRNWFFMVLEGKEYAVSRDYSASGKDIFEIIRILKALRNNLFAQNGITVNFEVE